MSTGSVAGTSASFYYLDREAKVSSSHILVSFCMRILLSVYLFLLEFDHEQQEENVMEERENLELGRRERNGSGKALGGSRLACEGPVGISHMMGVT